MKTEEKSILVFGETLVDLFSNGMAACGDDNGYFQFAGAPGGAPANVAANLAHMGLPVYLISNFSDDPLGSRFRRILAERGIDLSLSLTHENSKTALAMVLLAPTGERRFRLYLGGSVLEKEFVLDNLPPNLGVFHFGSVMHVFENGVKAANRLLELVASNCIIRSYDINIRPDILQINPAAARQAVRVLDRVDVLKISDEDLGWINENIDPELVRPEDFFRYGVKLIAYTEGPRGARLMTPTRSCNIPAPEVEVVDTTGGGDAFIAGVLASLIDLGVGDRSALLALDAAALRTIGVKATECAKIILSQPGGMPPIRD